MTKVTWLKKIMNAAAVPAIGLLLVAVVPTTPAEARGSKGKITCSQGIRIVERSGFAKVRPSACKGGTYVYLGVRKSGYYIVRVNAKNGKIRNARRTWIAR